MKSPQHRRPRRRLTRATAALAAAAGAALISLSVVPGQASATGGDRFTMPASVSFGTVTLGSSAPAPTQTITLRNRQLLPTAPLKVALLGADANSFSIAKDTCGNKVVLGGGTCAITVRFVPTTEGSKSAHLKVSGLVHSAQTTLLGQAEVEGRAVLSAPDEVDFGTVLFGGIREVVVTNTGNGPTSALTVSVRIERSNDRFDTNSFTVVGGEADCRGAVVQPGESCTVYIQLTGRSTAFYFGTVEVFDGVNSSTLTNVRAYALQPADGP